MEIDSLEIEWAVTSKGRKEKENEFGFTQPNLTSRNVLTTCIVTVTTASMQSKSYPVGAFNAENYF